MRESGSFYLPFIAQRESWNWLIWRRAIKLIFGGQAERWREMKGMLTLFSESGTPFIHYNTNYELWMVFPNKTKKHNNPTLPSSPYQGIHTPSENKCSDRAEIWMLGIKGDVNKVLCREDNTIHLFVTGRGGTYSAFICDFVSFPLGPGGLYCSLVI